MVTSRSDLPSLQKNLALFEQTHNSSKAPLPYFPQNVEHGESNSSHKSQVDEKEFSEGELGF